MIVQNHAMLTAQRKKLILGRLAAEGLIVAKDLAYELGTSEDTIRRDLRELAQGGKLPGQIAVASHQARQPGIRPLEVLRRLPLQVRINGYGELEGT